MLLNSGIMVLITDYLRIAPLHSHWALMRKLEILPKPIMVKFLYIYGFFFYSKFIQAAYFDIYSFLLMHHFFYLAALFYCEKKLICFILATGSEKVAVTEPVGGCSLPITPTEDRTDVSSNRTSHVNHDFFLCLLHYTCTFGLSLI